MSDFKAKMLQNWFWRGSVHNPLGSLQHSPVPLAEIKGTYPKGRGGEGKKRREEKGGMERERRGGGRGDPHVYRYNSSEQPMINTVQAHAQLIFYLSKM